MINIKSIIGKVGNILSILYSTYIAQKLLYGYINIKSAYFINDNDIILNERKMILVIYLIIYYLISFLINL